MLDGAVAPLQSGQEKVANSVIMLTMRAIWLERNAQVFDATASSISRVLDSIIAEWEMWVTCRRGHTRGIP
jgi:hypothetical protein